MKDLKTSPSLKITGATNNPLAVEINPTEFTARIASDAKEITSAITSHKNIKRCIFSPPVFGGRRTRTAGPAAVPTCESCRGLGQPKSAELELKLMAPLRLRTCCGTGLSSGSTGSW